jgi:hypothetical protein
MPGVELTSAGRGAAAAEASNAAALTTTTKKAAPALPPQPPQPPSASGSGRAAGSPKSKKPTLFQRFSQQQLAGWSPILTPGALVVYFTLAGAACAAVGAPLLAASLSVVQVRARYDDVGPLAGLDAPGRAAALAEAGEPGVPLTLDIPVGPRTLNPPVYVYFELGGFYQNHKRYVRSRDDQQMGGVAGPPAERCAPERETAGGAPIVPCGLAAWSLFNDTFSGWTLSDGPGTSTPLTVDDSSIAWPSDAKHLYGAVLPQNFNDDPASRGGGTATGPLNEDQHLMAWLRPAASPTVRKLWGVIDTALPAGSTLRVDVANRYNTYGWGGAKAIVLTTATWAGGRNHFLGAAYLAVSGACLLAAAAFALGAGTGCCGLVRRRRFGDPAELSWNRVKK